MSTKEKESKNNKGSISSPPGDSYVCNNAILMCSNGDKTSRLIVSPLRTIWLTGEPQANIDDHKPMKNIQPFGKCHTVLYPPTGAATSANHGKLTPMPCQPNTMMPWMRGKDDVLLRNFPALLKTSNCRCAYGGNITIVFDGQGSGDSGPVVKQPKKRFS